MGTTKAINTLYKEIDWLGQVIDHVIRSYLMQEGHENNWLDIPVPNLADMDCAYARTVKDWELNRYQRLALVLAMTTHLKPEVLDVFFGKNQIYDRGFTEFGGFIDKNHSGFLPTGQTLVFLVSATDPELRYEVMKVLGPDSILIKEQVLVLGDTEDHLPQFNGILFMNDAWLHYFLTGSEPKIEQSVAFPAQKISTSMDWKDIVLDNNVLSQIEEIKTWLHHGKTLMEDWGLKKMLKPGYRALFYGPPGTGKTLTAKLLGKASGRDVYKVDLSLIISKYIGETEKNLARIFDMAEHKDWILFFDEADSLFGKRTQVKSKNDRYANQELAYLLQRIEDFPGLVILAANIKNNIDEAFSRRFQSMIHFSIPGPEERYQLWENAFSSGCTLSPEMDLHRIAEDYEMSGGTIINVLRYCALATVSRNDTVVTKQELLAGIRKEFKKLNK